MTESLNTDMVKAENPEAVVATEPQGKLHSTALCSHLFDTVFYSDLLPLCTNISIKKYNIYLSGTAESLEIKELKIQASKKKNTFLNGVGL